MRWGSIKANHYLNPVEMDVKYMIALLQIFSLSGGVLALSNRTGWAVFVFFLAFSPRSLGIEFGGGASLTMPRMALPLLLVLFLVSGLTNRSSPPEPRDISIVSISALLASLSFYKIIATIVNSGEALYAIEDMLRSFILFWVVFQLANERYFAAIIKAMAVSAVLTVVMVLLESVMKSPLHSAIANQAVMNDVGLDAAFRNGQYRAIGIFDGPLQLGEFLVYSLATTLFLSSQTRTKRSALLGVASTLLVLVGILATGSRGALLTAIAVLLAFFFTQRWHRIYRLLRLFIVMIAISMIAVMLFEAFSFLSSRIEKYSDLQFHLLDVYERSTASRTLQFSEVMRALSQRPFMGFGFRANFSDSLDDIRLIDNYYLRVGLEGGYVAIALFLLLIAQMFSALFKTRVTGMNRDLVVTRTYGVMLLVGFASMKMFLSQPVNNMYFYILIAVVLARLGRLQYTDCMARNDGTKQEI